jgi:addiction module RelE/StbE family toxin
MIHITYDPKFLKTYRKISNKVLKNKIQKQIRKLLINPKSGKPMRNIRKGTRELHISPYRLSYTFDELKKEIVLLEFYHKDEQ